MNRIEAMRLLFLIGAIVLFVLILGGAVKYALVPATLEAR